MKSRFLIAAALVVSLVGCRRNPPQPTPLPPVPPPQPPRVPQGAPSAIGFNMNAPILPDARLTPGDVLDVTPQDFCTPGYSKKVRNVPSSLKKKVYARYGITSRKRGEYEVDHLISLQLGGSNSIRNLWPQSYQTQPWNAHVKDAIETRLHDKICDGEVDAKTAQQEIARDWIAAYKKYFKSDVPLKTYSDGAAEDEAAILPQQITQSHARRSKRKSRKGRTEVQP